MANEKTNDLLAKILAELIEIKVQLAAWLRNPFPFTPPPPTIFLNTDEHKASTKLFELSNCRHVTDDWISDEWFSDKTDVFNTDEKDKIK